MISYELTVQRRNEKHVIYAEPLITIAQARELAHLVANRDNEPVYINRSSSRGLKWLETIKPSADRPPAKKASYFDTHDRYGREIEENPTAIRAQVRRLASGQIQLKIPLKRGENALRKAQELAKALGRKVVSVARVGAGGRAHNPVRRARGDSSKFRVVREDSGPLQPHTGIVKKFRTLEAAEAFIQKERAKLNRKPGYSTAWHPYRIEEAIPAEYWDGSKTITLLDWTTV